MNYFKRLFSYLGQYKKYAFLAPITVIGEVLLEIYIPFLMAKIIDVGITNRDMSYVLKIGGLMVLMSIVSLLLGVLSGRFAALTGTGLAKNIRQAVFYKTQDFSFANIDHFSTASLITRMTTDLTFIQNSAMMIVRIMFRAPVMTIGATIMSIRINGELATVFLFAIPILGAVIYYTSTRAFPNFRKMFNKYDAMNASVQENLIGIRVVKSFVRHDYEDEKLIKSATELMNAQKKAEKYIIINGPVMMATVNLCIILLLWFGGNKIILGEMQTGELISFINYTTQILMNLMMMSMVLVTVVISSASAKRILEVLDEKLDITDISADPNLTVEDGSVVFNHVDFSYTKNKDNLTLMDVNLTVKSGSHVGIIGGTGSAKSTLVQLLPRLYDVDDGSIRVGGHDVKEYKLETLRNAVAIVLQKNVLFSGTIRENLKWGNAQATDAEIEAACKAAQAHDFIMAFPDGYETELEQGGVNVSGGQKQRLCIARALLKHPKVMILDDSTSAVDTHTDGLIREALRDQYAGITTLIIAQRVASVMNADEIVVMDEGRINAIGTHEELLRSNPIYREVYESQKEGAAL